MKQLLARVQHFHDDVFPAKQQLFETLEQEQHPSWLFISCSDSRVIPSLLTQTEPGEMFSLRNTGNILPPQPGTGEEATVEYAVRVLGIRQVVVCGHSHCGAVQHILSHHGHWEEDADTLPAVARWLAAASGADQWISAVPNPLNRQPLKLEFAIKAHIRQQLIHLQAYECIQEFLPDLQIAGWYYCMDKGEVEVLPLNP